MNTNPSRRSPRDKTATAELRRNVVALRRQRLTFEEIGARCGFSGPRAYRVYADALKAIPTPNVEMHRKEQLDLIDRAIDGLLKVADNPGDDPNAAIRAWNSICRFLERKARLLGLDMPVSVNVETSDAPSLAVKQLPEGFEMLYGNKEHLVRYSIGGVDMGEL